MIFFSRITGTFWKLKQVVEFLVLLKCTFFHGAMVGGERMSVDAICRKVDILYVFSFLVGDFARGLCHPFPGNFKSGST